MNRAGFILPDYRKVRNVLLVLILLLALVLSVQLLLSFIILPEMQIGQILLESTVNLPDQALLAMGGLSGGVNYLSLDEKTIRETYETSPMIRKAFIQKQFPNTLKIVLYGRNPLGISLVEQDGVVVPAVFDDQGVIFRVGGNADVLDLPVLTGIRYGNVREGMVLPEALQPLFRDLETLKEKQPVLYSQISEIKVVKKSDEHYDLKLYLSSWQVPVLTASRLDDALLRRIILVLDVLKGKNMLSDLEYADFRSGQVVLKMKEGR